MESSTISRYKKLINSRAWSFHYSTGISFEELQAEAVLAYVECLPHYDESKGTAFSTFLYHCITNHLSTFCGAEMKHMYTASIDALEDDISSYNPKIQNTIYLKEVISALSIEAQGVLSILFEAPDELMALAKNHTPKAIRGALFRYLRTLGWSWPIIWRSFREIKLAVQNM